MSIACHQAITKMMTIMNVVISFSFFGILLFLFHLENTIAF